MTVDSHPLRYVIAAIREVKGDDIPGELERADSLVLRLGFDSMNMALLSLALESQLGRAVALDGWIASHPDPHDLTVGSLSDYLADLLRRNERPSVSP
jgi:acyl carrier protein